ncbi:MAG: glutamate--tRNA ligase family protein [Candidatus Dojkabacteria bacterium]|jgi:glutamyl-tRNA synthetase|nr:glutamate--tRNA ligase family protein [Candidatus Dojkabacteria bacterium]MDD2270198.1 glutamate--tRNA ligase family protein [Candidatus Dojkabacteria bacterium]
MRTEEENVKLADLLFPSIEETSEDIISKYPNRNLEQESLVLRFAPSPTGFVHVGNIYTSLIDRKLADQTNGLCILRIEDTDKEREVEGGTDFLINRLSEFGIQFDESVHRGDYGPYIQSERLDIYKTFAKDMVRRGVAYPCFATEEELSEVRKKQEELGVRTGYYGSFAKWRDVSFDDIKKELEKGSKFAIRLYSTGTFEKKFEFDDEIKGRCTFSENDMDIVLLKSDGYPTYHFAHPIDDTLMGINLVIRTTEWFPSVPIHLEIFEKLNFKKIAYAHPSPLMKMEGGNKRKLSKRKDPEADVKFFLEKGYPVAGIAEYFLNIMNSNFSDWRRENPNLPYSDFQLKLEKFNRAGALFDMVKLEAVCRDYIARLLATEVYDEIFKWAQKNDDKLVKRMEENREYCIKILNIEREGAQIRKDIVKWRDAYDQFSIFFDDMSEELDTDKLPANVEVGDAKKIIGKFLETYDINDKSEEWFNKIKGIGNELGYTSDYKAYKDNPEKFKGKVGDVAMVLRIALTKKAKTPDLYQTMQVMGKERVEERLKAFVI